MNTKNIKKHLADMKTALTWFLWVQKKQTPPRVKTTRGVRKPTGAKREHHGAPRESASWGGVSLARWPWPSAASSTAQNLRSEQLLERCPMGRYDRSQVRGQGFKLSFSKHQRTWKTPRKNAGLRTWTSWTPKQT